MTLAGGLIILLYNRTLGHKLVELNLELDLNFAVLLLLV